MVRRIYETLLEQSVNQQTAVLTGDRGRAVHVAYQGVEQAYSYLAASKFVSSRRLTGELVGYRSFSAAVQALLSADADLAVLPIENTTAGSINEVYDLVREHEVSIVGEETWKVDHCLAGVADVPISALNRILSHPQGLEQCSLFLQSLTNAQPTPYFDTASAVRDVAKADDPTQAAIGSPEAAAAYGLVVLRRGIANQEENYTRFIVLAREPQEVDIRVACKTSMILVTRHEKGALLRCLEVLSDSDLSMVKLESRPRPGRPWEYMFFLDVEANIADPRTQAALDELRATALHLKILGSYPSKATKKIDVQAGELRSSTTEIALGDGLIDVAADTNAEVPPVTGPLR